MLLLGLRPKDPSSASLCDQTNLPTPGDTGAVETEVWRKVAILALAILILLDVLINPWLVGLDALLFLAAALVYLFLRRRRASEES